MKIFAPLFLKILEVINTLSSTNKKNGNKK